MKVLLVVGSYPPAKDSQADGIWHLAHHLEDCGIATVVVTRHTRETAEFISRDRRRTVVLLGEQWDLRAVLRLAKVVAEHNPDVVHLWYEAYSYDRRFSVCLIPLVLKLRRHGVPILTTVHELWGPARCWRLGNGLLFTFSDLLSIRQASYRAHLARFYGWVCHKVQEEFSPSNVPVLNEATERVRFYLRARCKLSPDDVVACYFGFLHGEKGLEEVFEAVRIIREEGQSLFLLMICEVDLARDAVHRRMHSLAREKGISEAVIWVGRCEPATVSIYLSMADFCILSYPDGATERRSSLMAALAHGLPVIATRSDQTPAVFEDGSNMLLVPFGDVPALVEAVTKLSNDPHLRSTLAAHGRQLYESFSWSQLIKITLQGYDKLVGTSRCDDRRAHARREGSSR